MCLAGLFGEAPDEVLDEQRNIFRSLAKRRNGDGKDVQPVEKILAKGSSSDRGRQVTIGCRYQADVYRDRMITPHPLEFFLLQYPQECDLRFHRQFADFIQEQCPAIRGFKPAQPPLQCAGEGSLFVSEKLGSNQRLRNGGAVDLTKALVARFDLRCSARAISSLPVPVSPRIRTVESDGATFSTCFSTWRMGLQEPTISSNIEERSISSRRTRFSFRSRSSVFFWSSMSVAVTYQRMISAGFVFQRVVLNKLPAILPALRQDAHFQLEWLPTQKAPA